MSRLAGKVAVITGGSSGIGLATAQRFVQEAAYVFITGRRQSELDNAKALIGDGLTTVAADASKSADLDELFATVLEEKGGLDILVANAGRVEPEELGKITEENFDATFDLNARGTLFTVQKALPLMRDGGSVIVARLDRRLRGHSRLHHLQRHQGGTALLYPHVDKGVQRPRHPVQHVEPGAPSIPPSWTVRPTRPGSGRDQGGIRRGDTAQPDGPPRRDRLRRFVFGLRRQQLRRRRRAQRGRRHGAGVTR